MTDSPENHEGTAASEGTATSEDRATSEGTAAGGAQQSTAMGSDLNRWLLALSDELGVDPAVFDIDLVLDLARDVAHAVGRPAVPLTNVVVGYAVASGTRDRAELERVVARATALAGRWAESSGTA